MLKNNNVLLEVGGVKGKNMGNPTPVHMWGECRSTGRRGEMADCLVNQ